MTTQPRLQIIPQGGTMYSVRLDGAHIAYSDFGSLDEDGQPVEDADEIIEMVIDAYDIDPALAADAKVG